MARAVFFDRDGTLMVNHPYLGDPRLVRLTPNAAAAVRLARQEGFLAILVTNQSGIARGLVSRAEVDAVNRRLVEALESEGATLESIYLCPHHPEVGIDPRLTRVCECRKPAPGMLLAAARDHQIELQSSALIGDSPSDVAAAAAVGARAYLVGDPLAAVRAFLLDLAVDS